MSARPADPKGAKTPFLGGSVTAQHGGSMTLAMHAPRPKRAYKPILLQAALALALLALLVWGGHAVWKRLRAEGIASGFDVFERPAGIQIITPFLSQTADDSYAWLLFAAFMNTTAVSLLSIALAFGFGLCLGVGLVAHNKIVSTACTVYVEIFRNIPLILQAVFWYTTLTLLPTPRQNPPALGDVLYLSNKGAFFAGVSITDGPQFWLLCGLALAVFSAVCWQVYRRLGRAAYAAGWGLLAAALAVGGMSLAWGWPLALDRPVLRGFSYAGGLSITPEFLALVFSCMVFSSAYIAEIFRGGLQSVPQGQVEAARTLGLPAHVIFFKIRTPIAFRSMIPALSNIFLFIVKATAIGAAIGYADLYAITVVGISQTGQAIEFLAAMMLGYLALNYSITQIMGWINHKIAFKGGRS